MKKAVGIIIVLVMLLSCQSKFPDYIEINEHVYMQLVSFEESDQSFKNNRYVAASIEIYDKETRLFKHYKEEIIEPSNNNWKFLFKHLAEGDSASFMVNQKFLKKENKQLELLDCAAEFIKINVKVYSFKTKADGVVDKEMFEHVLLKKYLEGNDFLKQQNGIYFKTLQEGKGEVVAKGKVITIHYKGSFINELVFDNTYNSSSFTFNYGTPGQVIGGLDIALRRMKMGEKAKIIIPSYLAFGEEGSSTLIVPPFSSVLYELEIVNVK